MSFPGFPNALPPLIANAPELSPADRAWIASLLPHQRAEAERVVRNTSAIFAQGRPDESSCPDCGGTGVVTLMRPTCCGNFTSTGECRSHCAVPEEYQEPCETCGAVPLQDALRNELYRAALHDIPRCSPTAPATGGNAGGFNVTRSASAHPYYSMFAEDRQEPCDGSDASVAASVDPVGPTDPALRNESYREGLGMTEALAAGRHDDANRREPWAKRVAGGRR